MLVPRIGNLLQATLFWTERTSKPGIFPKLRQLIASHRIPTGIPNGIEIYTYGYQRLRVGKKLQHLSTTPIATTNATQTLTTTHCHYHSLVNAQFLRTVIQKLPFLMNEIRTKKNFSSILINCSPFKSNYYRYYQQRRRHHYRSYRASSKSNKVFLRYTPRDPRLRFNKHSSELSEDIFNYGELIGGNISTSNSSTYLTQPATAASRYNYVEQIQLSDWLCEQCCMRLFSSSTH